VSYSDVVGKQVGWLNKSGTLAGRVSYSDVVGALSQMDVTQAMQILKDVETNGASIPEPTNYMAACQQLGIQATPVAAPKPARAMMAAAHGGCGGMMMPQMMPMQLQMAGAGGMGVKRQWKEEAKAPAGDENSKTISKMVGRLNKYSPLMQQISYSDIKEPLELVGLEVAMKILQDIEMNPMNIKDPTNYVIAAAKRAVTGEAIPAKQRRMA